MLVFLIAAESYCTSFVWFAFERRYRNHLPEELVRRGQKRAKRAKKTEAAMPGQNGRRRRQRCRLPFSITRKSRYYVQMCEAEGGWCNLHPNKLMPVSTQVHCKI